MKEGLKRAKELVYDMYDKEYNRYRDLWVYDRPDPELLAKIENRLVYLNDVLLTLEIELRKVS